MAKLERKNVKIFASNPNNATQVSAFLTGKNETPDYSSDPDVIQNTYYPKGWLGQGENDLPQVTDMNGVMFTESYKTAYLYQQGIADWIVTQEYAENSFCQVEGVLYKSLADNNIGNDPTTDDGTNWLEIAFDPYVGENLGNAEGIYAGKTSNNELQFKGIAVTGNGNISASDDTITISIGGGGTGDVYWGAIDGTLSNQSDLQQALNLKQNTIGYTPEDVSNKVTTVRTDTVATDTAYPSELATRTAIDNAITSANNYTDSALQTLNSDAFVLYANSWTDVDTGTLTTTAPTGTGTTHTLSYISAFTYENIANFTYTTTQETTFNNTFTYDVLVPIRNATINNWLFKFKLTITHSDVNAGNPTTLFDYTSSNIYAVSGNLNIEIKQDLLDVTSITYPVGSTISFSIKAQSNPGGETSPYNFDLLVYDQNNPIVISRNRGINKYYVTSYNTQTLGYDVDQEYFNSYINRNKQPNINGLTITETSTTFDVVPKSSITTSNIGSSSYPFSNLYTSDVYSDNVVPITVDSNDNNSQTLTLNNLNIKFKPSSMADPGTKLYIDPVGAYLTYLGFNNAISFIKVSELIETPALRGVSGSSISVEDSLVPDTNESLGSLNKPFYETYSTSLYSDTIKLKTNLLPQTSGSSFYDIEIGSQLTPIYKTYTTDLRVANLKNMSSSGIYLHYDHNDISPSADNKFWLGYNHYYTQINCANFHVSSDINNKENIKDYNENALKKLDKINPITYNFKDSEKDNIRLGISAQELREQEPLIVSGQIKETKNGIEESNIGIDLYGLTVFAIKAIKELNEKVKTLEARIEELEGKKEEEELEK